MRLRLGRATFTTPFLSFHFSRGLMRSSLKRGPTSTRTREEAGSASGPPSPPKVTSQATGAPWYLATVLMLKGRRCRVSMCCAGALPGASSSQISWSATPGAAGAEKAAAARRTRVTWRYHGLAALHACTAGGCVWAAGTAACSARRAGMHHAPVQPCQHPVSTRSSSAPPTFPV